MRTRDVTTMCSGSSNSFAYLNPGDPNYSAVIAALMAAKMSGATVDIRSSVDGVGCCHIYDVVVH